MTGDAQIVAKMASALLAQRVAAMRNPGWQPLPHQIPPTGEWRGWATIAGRGAGKTDSCAHYVAEHIKGPPCLPGPSPHWIGIIAPTLGDAATSCYAGPSGLRVHSPDARLVQRAGGLTVVWPNGSEAKLFGAHTPEDVERLRSGGNRCLAWLEEMAAWRYLDEAWAHMRFGLRVGPQPRWVASTTPKPRPLIAKIYKGEIEGAILTRASFRDNPHLPQHIKDALEEEYGGTQLGRQELEGELIEQDENALWTHEGIDAARVRPDDLPKLVRVTVGVDPSGGAGEQGIVVAGKAMLEAVGLGANERRPVQLANGFVLADRTVRMSPGGWARRAVQAAVDYEADDIVVERNYGGQMAIATIRAAADSMGIAIPIREVTATSGKRIRATPVAALTEQRRWHHAGHFPELENQMCTWYEELGWSPDRLDAMVWTGWHNKVVQRHPAIGSKGMSMAATRAIG